MGIFLLPTPIQRAQVPFVWAPLWWWWYWNTIATIIIVLLNCDKEWRRESFMLYRENGESDRKLCFQKAINKVLDTFLRNIRELCTRSWRTYFEDEILDFFICVVMMKIYEKSHEMFQVIYNCQLCADLVCDKISSNLFNFGLHWTSSGCNVAKNTSETTLPSVRKE